MKIRPGFVSNSSSASFTCEICSNIYLNDHSPLITGGLCDPCKTRHKMCNVCGNIGTPEDYFKTDERWLDISDIPRLAHQAKELGPGKDGEIYLTYTCRSCLSQDENADLFNALLDNLNRESWAAKISNPDYKLTPIDIRISEFLMSKGN